MFKIKATKKISSGYCLIKAGVKERHCSFTLFFSIIMCTYSSWMTDHFMRKPINIYAKKKQTTKITHPNKNNWSKRQKICSYHGSKLGNHSFTLRKIKCYGPFISIYKYKSLLGSLVEWCSCYIISSSSRGLCSLLGKSHYYEITVETSIF